MPKDKKIITQEEALKVLERTPFPRNKSEHTFVLRFMFLLNDLAKKRGYRLFNWTDYAIVDEQLVASWILSNIEPLSKEMIIEKMAKERIIHKHFYHGNDCPQIFCGTLQTGAFEITDDWKEVTCKDCLRKKKENA